MTTAHKSLVEESSRERWLPLLELAMREVFEIMLGAKLESSDAERPLPLECTAMVGLAGPLCGVFTFRCGAEAAALIAGKMLGAPAGASDEQALDAIGEVCNMIAGNFKSKVSGLSESCVLSAPTVVVGGDYRVHSLAGRSVAMVMLLEGSPVSAALELRR
jgi:chemotaxis protein CheX